MNHETASTDSAQHHPMLFSFATQTAAVAAGTRICRQQARQEFGDWLWMTGNLPRAQQDAIACWLTHCATGWQRLLDPPVEILPTHDSCTDLRDALDDAALGRNVPVDVLARAAIIEQYQIPKQFAFDVYDGVDRLLRFPPLADWDEFLIVASKIGGATVAGLLAILEIEGADWQVAAMPLGQALWLTLVLATVREFHSPRPRLLPATSFSSFKLNPDQVHLPQTDLPWMQWARWHCQKIESLLIQSAGLLARLDFDGQRVLRNLLGVLWHLQLQWRLDPLVLWNPAQQFPAGERFRFRTRFFLGLDPDLPFAGVSASHHH